MAGVDTRAQEVKDKSLFLYLGQYLRYGIQPWHDVRRRHGIYTHARFDYIDYDAKSQWVGRGTKSALRYLDI